MDNIVDYLKWMGRFSFEELPFSEADAVVLTQASYYDLSLFEKYPDEPLTLSAHFDRIAAERHMNVNVSGTFASVETAEFFRLFAKSRRFRDIRVIDYTERFDEEKTTQFAAVTFLRENDFSFVSFRGTDDTLTGWKEDFMICFEKTQAQRTALEYASSHIRDDVKNYLGGHSKGANMALYASCLMDYALWNKVERVYLLDGPGICPEVMSTTEIARVNRRAIQIVPRFCIIGKLFEPEINHTMIVESSAQGFMQHDLLSWGIDHGRLMRARDHSPESENITAIINDWITDIPTADRRIFVSELFDNLSDNGCKTVADFSKLGADGVENILVSILGSSDASKKAVTSLPTHMLFGRTFRDIKETGFLKWARKNVIAKSVMLILIGGFFILASSVLLEIATKVVFVALTVAEIIFTIRRISKNRWQLFRVRYRLYLCISMVILCAVVLLRDQALYILGSLLFGVISLVITFVILDSAVNPREDNIFKRMVHFFEAAVSGIYGISFLIIPSEHIFRYIWGVGVALIVDGIFRLVIAYVPFFQKKKRKPQQRHLTK